MAPKVTRRQAAKRRLPRPYRQGELDGLCGVYSTINAVRTLCPEIDKTAAVYLFETLVYALPDAGIDTTSALVSGIGRSALALIIKSAIAHIRSEHDIELMVRRLPQDLRRSGDLHGLWTWLAERVSPERVAILGLGGRESHWTVAVEVTRHQIKLLDSGSMGVLRRKQCTVGRAATRYSVSPVQVFLVDRKGGE